MDRTYIPAEVCERFDVSKSTLYRWEDEGHIPAPTRNLRGEREYSRKDIEAIGRFVQARRHRRRYAQALADDTRNARSDLERLGEQNALFKFVNLQDSTGLVELREYSPLRSETIRQLIEIAVDHHTPKEDRFWDIMDVICETSRPRDRASLYFQEAS